MREAAAVGAGPCGARSLKAGIPICHSAKAKWSMVCSSSWVRVLPMPCPAS